MHIRTHRAHDPLFPKELQNVYQPPKQLYLRGTLPDEPRVAVVGTRKMTDYGRTCVHLLVPELVRLGCVIVSGLALGIDGAVHEATIEAGGKTVAVIGSGVDDASIYPRAHLNLAKRILEHGGGILSEYSAGTPSLPFHFPERNRIIAGLSQAVLVIEAPQKSGAMITARLALEAGREVWAVPGRITEINSWGPNELIKNGATPITNVQDIALALGVSPSKPIQLNLENFPTPIRQIMELLQSGPKSSDEISRGLKLGAGELGITLTELEMNGLVVSLGGGRFSLYT